MTKDNPIHVLVNNPVDIRRHLLMSAVDSLKTLERYEDFKKLKNIKKRKFLELSEKLNSINQDVSKLLSLIPNVTEEKIEKQVVNVEVKKRTPSMPKIDKENPKSRDLRKEMSMIQQKLERLNF